MQIDFRIIILPVILLLLAAIPVANESMAAPSSTKWVVKNNDECAMRKEEFSLPNIFLSTNPDPVATSDSASCIIPFRRAGNLILIEARADTTRGNFILDTGAPNLVLNITYFRNYPSVVAASGGGITGNIPAVAHTTVNDFSFGPIKYKNLQADVINLGHIEDTRGTKIFGLLGVNLFKQFEMIIDYTRSVILLHLIIRKEANTYKHEMLRDTVAYNTFPIDITENKIVVKAESGGKKLNFILDTGAESNVLDSRLPNKVFDNVTITRHITLSGSGSEKVEALYGDLSNMKIGNKTIGTLPILITNLEQMCLAYDYCIDGMLGFEFLSQHKIGFNFVRREMYLWK